MEAGVRLAQLPDGAARPLLAHSHVRALSTASGSYSSSNNTSQENWLCTFSFKIAFVNCFQNYQSISWHSFQSSVKHLFNLQILIKTRVSNILQNYFSNNLHYKASCIIIMWQNKPPSQSWI